MVRTPTLQLLNKGNEITKEEDLKPYLEDPKFQEALFLASPNLYNKLFAYLNNDLKREKDKKTLPYSLLQYISRMTSRCTPFGLFAGVSTGSFNEETSLIRSNHVSFRKKTRLDMNYLCALANDLAKNEIVKKQLIFYPNTSIYSLAGQIRYVEYIYQNANRMHRISSVENSPYLQKIITLSRDGACIESLAESLIDEEISKEDAMSFIDELIENQLLVSDLDPRVTGEDFFTVLKQKIQNLNGLNEISLILEKIDNKLQEINNKPIGQSIEHYLALAEILKKLDTKYEKKYLFQSDLYVPFHNYALKETITNDLYKGLEILNKISLKSTNNIVFEKFKKAFIERFEKEEVPLSIVFDSELGIGYRQNQSNIAGDITPLVDDLVFVGQIDNPRNEMTPFNNYLISKYTKALMNNSQKIIVSDEEIDNLGLKSEWKNLPDTFSTIVNIIEEETDYKVLMRSAGGSSATNLLGRFGHINESIYNYVNAIAEKEKSIHYDKVIAEIVHLPQTRTGNILFRPIYRDYEISYLAQSAMDKTHQLSIEDLTLAYRRGQIVLKSKKMKKEIIPRLSNAHTYSINSLPLYHFLCDLQNQNKRTGVGFTWGILANKEGFLPRVEYDNIILSRATWNLTVDEIKHLYKLDADQVLSAMNDIRTQWQIPETVALVDGDNELFVDLTSPIFIGMLLDTIKKRSNFKLVEFIHSPENAIVRDKVGNSYMSQFVFAFYKDINNKK
jgi:hypothetical protein